MNIFTARLPTTPGIIRIPFTHRHAARLIPLLPGLLELGGDHRRAGGSTARQRCCHPAPEETNREHFKHGGGGGSVPLRCLRWGQTHCPTWGEVPRSPRAVIPPSQSAGASPATGGTWKKFTLPVRRSGEFFLLVRTTGRIIISIVIKAVIGVLRVVKHRPAPRSAPVE